MLELDYSTIDQDRLRSLLPSFKIRDGCRIDKRSMGSACFGDAPGYPTYFLQHVYDASGDCPRSGSTTVLLGREVENAAGRSQRESLAKIYRPLPIEHERVRLWIAQTMQHLRHCYIDESRPKHDRIVIFPVRDYDLTRHTIEEAISLQAQRSALATIENHAGVRKIRETYPDFAPRNEQIDKPEAFLQEDWWERYASRPSSEDCPGYLGTPHDEQDRCRMCGRTRIHTAQAASGRPGEAATPQDREPYNGAVVQQP